MWPPSVDNSKQRFKIAVIGLGYVGLPLAIEFGKQYEVLGFDIDNTRIEELSKGFDRTSEADLKDLELVTTSFISGERNTGLSLSHDRDKLRHCNVFIVTVPTHIDKYNAPDLGPLLSASKLVGSVLKPDDLVVFESTVYPGCTEEDCVPVIEKESGLKMNKDFFVGYSPERINPGDKINTLTKIRKVTSGSTPEVAERVDLLYRSIITAGTHKVASIKIAEASKVIENAQRDLNISFVNELALIFDRIGIDTNDVIDAASSKWNFLKYKPGLVGGHCIGVDPYYLAHKSQSLGYHPQVILSGRRVNDDMGAFVANKVVKLMIGKNSTIKGGEVLILGITFKENCPDIRNTRVMDIYNELAQFGLNVSIYDPLVNIQEVKNVYGLDVTTKLASGKKYNAVILAVAHNDFLEIDYKSILLDNGVLFDTKACLNRELVDARL